MALQPSDQDSNLVSETIDETIDFHAWLGENWGVLLAHPGDCSTVCSNESSSVAPFQPEFAKRRTEVIAIGVDPIDSHQQWLEDIEDVTGARPNYPIVSDPNRSIPLNNGVIQPNASPTNTVRSEFVIGSDKKVNLTLTYPATTRRDFNEILRVIDSLQLSAVWQLATPAEWRSGDDVIIVPALSDEDGVKRLPGYTMVTPYFRTTAQPGYDHRLDPP